MATRSTTTKLTVTERIRLLDAMFTPVHALDAGTVEGERSRREAVEQAEREIEAARMIGGDR